MKSAMNATHSKSEFLYGQVRRGLQSGRYLPGQRIDPGTLAAEFKTSPTPVRLALFRLVGAGLLEDHARSGLHVPLPTEVALRDLYDWMERLLLMACDIGPSSMEFGRKPLDFSPHQPDVVKLTWQLFDEIARATRHRSLHGAVKQTNDRLAPIRRATQDLLAQPMDELARLNACWQRREISHLKKVVRNYHERRKQLVPSIVAVLTERRDFP